MRWLGKVKEVSGDRMGLYCKGFFVVFGEHREIQ